MSLISSTCSVILDALFPLSASEKEMLSIAPTDALKRLPPAPDYSGLAVDLLGSHSVFAYKDERVAKLIWHIKYKGSATAVKIGGYVLWQTLVTTAGSGGKVYQDTPSTSGEVAAGSRPPSRPPKRPEKPPPSPLVVIPMPITSRRRKERGYNQCELLVDEIERLEKTVDKQRFIFRKDILIRTQHAERQTLKGREARVQDAKGIFGVYENTITDELKKAPIVIIDDVITTGSTMYEAIQTMKKAGFMNVCGLSVAH